MAEPEIIIDDELLKKILEGEITVPRGGMLWAGCIISSTPYRPTLIARIRLFLHRRKMRRNASSTNVFKDRMSALWRTVSCKK